MDIMVPVSSGIYFPGSKMRQTQKIVWNVSPVRFLHGPEKLLYNFS